MTPCLVLLVALAAADTPAEDAAKREKEKLLGTWTVTQLEVNGTRFPAEATKDFQFIFAADKMTRQRGGKVESEAAYRVNPSKSPKWMDFTDGASKEKEKVVPVIYELDGDTLKLCFPADYKKDGKLADGVKRPEKLDGAAGSNRVLMVLKREKP